MKKYRLLVIAQLSLSLVAMEIIWTRLFSAEFFYTFAFLVLSLAILGLGLGALALRLFSFLNGEKKLWIYLSFSGLMMLAGPPLVFWLQIDFTLLYSSLAMIGKFLIVIILLSSSFFFRGVALALIFKHYSQEIPKLYMANLIGSGLGVGLAILLMENHFYVPRFVSEVQIALAIQGIKNANQHFAVYNIPNMRRNMLLLSKQPLTAKLLAEAPGEVAAKSWQYMHLLYPAPAAGFRAE